MSVFANTAHRVAIRGTSPAKAAARVGQVLDAEPQALRLLLEERAGARGAGRVGDVLHVAAVLVQEDEGEALAAHGNQVPA